MKSRINLSLLALSCVFISSSSFSLENAFAHSNQEHNHHNNQMDHHHQAIDVSSHNFVPAVNIEAIKDNKEGWNLKIVTENFDFAPQEVNQESSINQGHGHLYINGEKITRIYGNWYHISDLPKGENEIKITLNTNLHEDLIYQGTIIGDRTIIINE
ncbi:hypothetical protein AA637_13970 [Cyanobacterium sp. HL-69]|uniref:hypothetical protein n=1 Tax=Cyanobacterium sp. HL-69 TaxID=2054282 RepID=UPI000CA2A368|nr:hypothetical protein AA637_13970 [Cyanobacterium sp. HL-69]